MYCSQHILQKIYSISLACNRNYRVSVVGATSEVGRCLCLMLRTQPAISTLAVYDTTDETPGLVVDLAQIPSDASVQCFHGRGTLSDAIADSDLVIAIGKELHNPELSEESLLAANTEDIKTLANSLAKLNTLPFVGIVTEPLNILVPMAANIIKSHGRTNNKLFGITTIDALRAQSLFASVNKLKHRGCFVPVIGGHSSKTIIPLLTQSRPISNMNFESAYDFTSKLRSLYYYPLLSEAAKGWAPTLSTAFALKMFTRSIIRAVSGKTIKVNAFVENNDFGTTFFGGLVNVDSTGIRDMERFSILSQFECQLLEESIIQVREDVSKGKKMLELA